MSDKKQTKTYLIFAAIAALALIWIIGMQIHSTYFVDKVPNKTSTISTDNIANDKVYGKVGLETSTSSTDVVTEPIATDPPPITERRNNKPQPVDKNHPLFNTDMGYFLTYEYATANPSIRVKDKDTHKWLGTKNEGIGSENAEAALTEVADYANTIPDNIVWEDGWYVEPFTSLGTPVLIQKYGDHRGNHYSTLTVADDSIGGFYVEYWK